MSTKKTKCYFCDTSIKKGVKHCPKCNTVNPSVRVKEVILWTFAMVALFYIAGLIIR